MQTLAGTTGRRRLYLMRHGHVDYLAPEVIRTRNITEVPLTARGRMEAQAAGRALANVALDRAICSGLPRTRETAELVLAQSNTAPKLESVPELVEIHSGRPRDPVRDRKELVATIEFSFARAAEAGATMMADGEGFLVAQVRAVGAVRALLAAPGWQQALIVAHEGINRVLLSWASGAGLAAAGAFEQDTGCINVLDFDMVPAEDGSPTPEIARVLIKAVNLTPYNYVKHGMNLTSLEAIFDPDFARALHSEG
ncbi:MAG: histidine phosphatase family protein [Alphaproteobacteria bacterium]|nr:phosphoglycerate mutase family protein [Alphaproteobacteria bacterium]MDE1940463.1 histidine phosphatase family protein [Alphaproteobacteria bacterium]MDE2012575.1 histidine phosphatase family protein [Alphaproteobacteria bacterium]MDE2073440.1 histidine phosphatase family protein [Alphaproteobacteria bacterium]MDE2350944.1 histidine phosphatase family protein [Alphaproteobacteria bacterium]